MSEGPDRFADLLAAATVGVYALVAAGATTTLTDAAAACRSWPACGGATLTPALAIVWTHRLAAVVVGGLVLLAAVVAWRRSADRRVRVALAAALALYPVQIAVGAQAAIAPASAVSGLHLGIGMAIFAALVVALAWTLEPDVGADEAGEGVAPDAAEAAGPAEASSSSASAATQASDAAAPSDEPTPLAGERSGLDRVLAVARAYLRLTKPRLMWLLCLVAAAGMALAAGPELDARTVVVTLGGGVLAIGASGTFNNALEYERDRKMERTADRPVATDRVPRRNAVAFGVALTALSLACFLQVNLLAAALGLAAILYYSVIYTLVLKPNTVQNTVIGGFAGSLPALIGWAAVTGTVGLPGLALAGVIFLWTPAHFYNLAMAYREDYARGGFPMLPVVRGDAVARKHVLLYLGATLLAATALAAVSRLGPVYAATTVVFGAIFLWAAVTHHRERTRAAALRTFHASNAYLGAVLVAVVVDALAL